MPPRYVLLLSLLLFSSAASAERTLEHYSLSFRSADELIPLVQPHIDPGDSLSGQAQQLIVRAEPARQREIARLVEQLDVAPRSLLIAVRTAADSQLERSGADATGRAGADGGSATVRIYRSENARRDDLEQRVRALEGRPAFIAAALSLPVSDRAVVIGRDRTGVSETTRFIELSKGFQAIAHLSGERVSIDISAETAEPSGGAIRGHQVITTVSGRLGEWIALGASRQSGASRGAGIARRSRDARGEHRSVWLKVEALD